MVQNGKENRPGITVDAKGNSAVDPTANVLDLVEAANRRQDDLRHVENRRLEDLRVAAILRMDDLRMADIRRVDEQSAMRAEFQEKLAIAEAKRIDAIRAVDVAAVAVASDRATQQASVLATQVAQSAETLRGLVASTAASVALQLQNISTQFTDRLIVLEKAQYESKGKSGVNDPLMEQALTEMRRITTAQSQSAGKSEGIGASWGVLIGAVGLMAAIGSIIALVFRAIP